MLRVERPLRIAQAGWIVFVSPLSITNPSSAASFFGYLFFYFGFQERFQVLVGAKPFGKGGTLVGFFSVHGPLAPMAATLIILRVCKVLLFLTSRYSYLCCVTLRQQKCTKVCCLERGFYASL